MKFHFKIALIICIIFINLLGNNLFSQINNIDFNKLKVEQITPPEILKIKNEMVKNNLSIDDLEKLAMSKGMKANEFSLLKIKLETDVPKTNVELGSKIDAEPIDLDIESQNNPKAFKSKIFGSDLFTNPSLTFEPNSNMATPLNYILGTGDEMQIIIYGIQEFSTSTHVSKEGKINIPNIGLINVSGMTFEAATAYIKKACGNVFSTIRSGQSNVSITLTKIRTIKVTIIGGKKSGNYSVSSLATLFNALYLAGGPDENGSYRNIELIRDNKIIKKIYIYKYIINGDQSDNVGLKENDIIRIPVYNCRVSIEGRIKTSGIFELLPEENFNDLLKYCSGFSESAYLSSIKLIQNTEKELRIIDLTKDEYISYKPKSGDVFKVGEILNKFENRISIKGSVYRPDDYSFSPGMKVSNLISKADGLTGDAYMNQAQITRLREDYSKEIISISLNKVFSGDSLHDIKLNKEDELLVFSMFDFKDNQNINIGGEVRKPGKYPFVKNIKLFDLLIQSGGFTDEASKRIEISRIIKKDQIILDQKEIATILTIEITDNVLTDESKNIVLEPNDVIQVRKIPIYQNQKSVLILGYVEYPGNYTIANKDERILDLINRTGGLKSEANQEGIYVIRGESKIPINYIKILKKPNSLQNIRLQPGDEVRVLKLVRAIKIEGSVSVNTEIPFEKGKSVRYYLNSVGGVNENGWKKKIYCVYPNGITSSTKSILFIKNYPEVLAGTTIKIPAKPEKKERSSANFVGIASVSTSMATMIAVLAKLFQE